MNSYESISQLLRLSYIDNEAADRRNIESGIETLLARLAAVEAEWDAARAEAEKLRDRAELLDEIITALRAAKGGGK